MNKRLLLIDNYDSFTYNLYQLFANIDNTEVEVFRHDAINPKDIEEKPPDGIIISPGPGDPSGAGISKDIVLHFNEKIPILGVCLGMQCINEVFGGKTILAPVPCHGKKDTVEHSGKSILKGLPSPFTAARYHSLITEVLSNDLRIIASNKEGIPMALMHRNKYVHGVQFHPESFMTEHGEHMARNFLEML